MECNWIFLSLLAWYNLTYYYFPFEVRLLILFDSMYFISHPLREGSDKDRAQVHMGFHSFSFVKTQACNFIKKETLAQVFSCEFCEISKNTFFTEHLRVAASGSITLCIIQYGTGLVSFYEKF